MDLRSRMALAVALVFGILFAAIFAIAYVFAIFGVLSGLAIPMFTVGGTLLLVLLQWWAGPHIIRWLFKIDWVDGTPEDPRLARVVRYIARSSSKAGVRAPRFGVVPDDNPNAFCFGWTKNRSHLVITRGVLKYCDDEEVEAVAAHEMGHIAHNDFVVMTIMVAIPLVFYAIYKGCDMMLRNLHGNSSEGAGYAAMAAGLTAIISYLVYIVSYVISLLISRYREYWADDFSADSTGRPNRLASALVKIAYGLAEEGRGERKQEKGHRIQDNALMFFNVTTARAIAAQASDADGSVSLQAIKETMSWDLWNPWAAYYEIQMTHPLPAKRLLALGDKAEAMGQRAFVKFDLVKPESYWDDFLKDVLASWSWLLAIPAAWVAYRYLHVGIISAIGVFMLVAGLLGFLYLRFYRYGFIAHDATVRELLRDPKAGPVRGHMVRLRGRIVGRGVPGLWFNEDLKLDDGTGLLLIDSRTISGLLDLLQGVFATKQFVGQEVEVVGWFRRQVVPVLELRRITGPEVRRTIRRPYVTMWCAAIVAAIGLLLATVSTPVFAAVTHEQDGKMVERDVLVSVEGSTIEGDTSELEVGLEGHPVGTVYVQLEWVDDDAPELPSGPLEVVPANRPDTFALTAYLPDGTHAMDRSSNDGATHEGSIGLALEIADGSEMAGTVAILIRCEHAGDVTGEMLGRTFYDDHGNNWVVSVGYKTLEDAW